MCTDNVCKINYSKIVFKQMSTQNHHVYILIIEFECSQNVNKSNLHSTLSI